MNKYQESAQKEQNLLNDIEAYMGSYGLQENTPDTPAGTHVKPPAKWLGTMVTAVADGKGNTIPVPKEFYYVGGDYTNGVIISDEPVDAYDGIIDKTTWEYTTSLVGNQFVWIPCNPANYHKTSWDSSYISGVYDSESGAGAELMQVSKYGGFYVGRYEAGLDKTVAEYTGDQISNGINSPAGYNVVGMPKSKAGELPWIFINQINSKKSAEEMYKNSEYVTSGLITGTQWDVMLNKFIGTTNQNNVTFTLADMTNSSQWGNYANSSTSYTGRSAMLVQSGITWNISSWGSKQRDAVTGDRTEYTTGASKKTEAYHTYDVAGNLWEWTEEIGKDTNYCVLRGGSCVNDATTIPACFRNSDNTTSHMFGNVGFRVVLYIK